MSGKIPLLDRRDAAKMRVACEKTARVLKKVASAVVPGITTGDLDEMMRAYVKEEGGKATFLGYNGYPGAICISINDEVIHGIPGKRVVLPEDVVSLDAGVWYDGFTGDSALTVMVGVTDPDVIRLVETTRRALEVGISAVKPGAHLSDVSHAIQGVVEGEGFSVVRDFVGHGVGRHLHEEPSIPNYGAAGHGPVLKPGMMLAIEPMVNMGAARVRILDDDWTVVTADGKPAAHFEHTVAVVEGGAEILTLA